MNDILKTIAALVGRPLTERHLDLSWAEVGVDSFTATELLLRLEETLPGTDAADIEAAMFVSSTVGELVDRLTEVGDPR